MIYVINIKSKSEQIISEPHKHKKKDIVFKELENIKPENKEVEYILKDTIKDCRNFHTFVYGCVYDHKHKNLENNEEVILSITLEFMKSNSQFFKLKKIKEAAKNSFRFKDILLLTIKLFSSLSKMNICYYIK